MRPPPTRDVSVSQHDGPQGALRRGWLLPLFQAGRRVKEDLMRNAAKEVYLLPVDAGQRVVGARRSKDSQDRVAIDAGGEALELRIGIARGFGGAAGCEGRKACGGKQSGTHWISGRVWRCSGSRK